MKRLLAWTVGGALLVATTGLVIVTAEPTGGPPFIVGGKPVTEDQVRQKLLSDGWTNIQMVRAGRYFEAIATKNGQNSKIAVDSQTGRLAGTDSDDDD